MRWGLLVRTVCVHSTTQKGRAKQNMIHSRARQDQLPSRSSNTTANSSTLWLLHKGMYRLPHTVLLANKLLEKRLIMNGNKHGKLVPDLWKHDWQPIDPFKKSKPIGVLLHLFCWVLYLCTHPMTNDHEDETRREYRAQLRPGCTNVWWRWPNNEQRRGQTGSAT